jgi:NADH-quinone oxidoreductase subunit N
VTRSFLSYNIWIDLLNSNQLNLNENLAILKQILVYYNDSESIGAIQNITSLNLELVSIGFILICISILIKLAVAPFHFWSLDVYEGSPNTTTFFFAVVPKIGLFVLLMRLCYVSFYQIFDSYQTFFFLLSVLSVFVGALGGLEQRKLKTLLAYSSIGHTGYLLLSFSTGNVEGMQMMFYYLAIYMISGLCFWSVYLFLRQKRNFYFNKSNKELGDLVLLKESNPMLALILAITLFSIAGIPPIVGFLAKIGIFMTVVKSSAYLVAVLSILFSVISTFYYIRLIKVLYFENTLVGKLYIPITTQKALLISVLALSLIVLCLDPTILYLVFYKATLLAS